MQNEIVQTALDTVIDAYCGRHPRGFKALAELARPDFWFRDPFVEIHGFDAFVTFLRESGAHRSELRWDVSGHAASGLSGYARWRYTASYRDGIALGFDGMSEFGFDEGGRLAFQIDFWDSAEALVRDAGLRDAIDAAKRRTHV